MYHRGGDRGWHRGQHERDVHPPRAHDSRMYRGGYHNAREHDGYGQYYDHTPREDRNYNQEHYEAPSYHGEHPPYHEYREQGYHRGGHHDSGYQEYRGGYWQGRGKIAKYNKPVEPHPKQYPYKQPKSFKKESDVKIKDSSPKPVHTVIHNPGRNIVTICGSPEHRNETKSIPSKDKSLERDVANPTKDSAKHTMHDSTKPEEDNKKKPDDTRPVENSEIQSMDKVIYDLESAQPSEEDTEGLDESEQLLEAMKTLGGEAKSAIKEVKTEHEEVKIDFIKDSVHAICALDQDATERKKAQLSGNRMAIADLKQEEETSSAIVAGKRIKMENEGFCIKTEPEDTFFEKRARKSHDNDHFYSDKPVEIPLLDGWTDMPSEAETAGSSTQVQTDTAENGAAPDTAQQLRKAFILARKDEIELAFSRDCRTFAFVASTLLKKDPSMEAAVTNALRSCLQDVASHCVQELTSFIDHYDHVLNPNTNRRPKSDP